MKSIIVSVAVAAGLMVAGSAMAADAVKMPADAGKCLACHKIDGKQVGPGWKQVSEKYKGQADAEATLVKHITEGGKDFGWKMGTMPARGMIGVGAAGDAQIASLAKFIVGIAK
ncbi:MAG: c-type cytochrome [Gallionella sp.]